jgi:plastocyanin
MSDATVFYIIAGILAGSAVVTSFIGLTVDSFPGKFAPVIVIVFVALIGGAATFAVKNGKHEETVRAAENEEANETIESEQGAPPQKELAPGEAEGGEGKSQTVSGPGGTLDLKASPTELAFDKKSLNSKPGEVTIDFENPSAIPHNIAIEQNGEIIEESETLAEGKTSITAPLAPGEYTFLCTVPGHAEAGMTGTLTVE